MGRATPSKQEPSAANMKHRDVRWWEFYFVRYFVGSIVGAAVILFLNATEASALYLKILPKTYHLTDLTSNGLIVLGVLGLGLCLVASAPVLVMHATRGCISYKKRNVRQIAVFIFIVLPIVVFSLLSQIFSVGESLAWIFIVFIFGLQSYMLVCSFFDKSGKVFSYYREICVGRAENSALKQEYIESYRHLREHGNSLLILFLRLA